MSVQLAEFYFIRYSLAFVCALCQTILFKAISATLNGRIGIFFLLVTILSPGNFHASAAFLPSSFAMYMSMLGTAYFMDWHGGIKTSKAIFCFAMAGVLGWPFAVALCIPYLMEEVVLAALGRSREAIFGSMLRIFRGIVAGLAVLVSFDGLS